MTFLAVLEERQRALVQRVAEIRRVMASAQAPSMTDPAAVTNGIRFPIEIRDRLIEVQGRHGFRSVKDVVYAALLLGLVTMERLEPTRDNGFVHIRRRRLENVRVLSESDISELRDRGYGQAL
jgi:hypothetical protein